MVDFDPGEGWREVPYPIEVDAITYVEFYDAERDHCRYWVREEPVQPLPTEPYTVIRPFWDTTKGSWSDKTLTLEADGRWGPSYASSAWVQERITGFEVLAEPQSVITDRMLRAADETIELMRVEREQTRRETAKAVLDRLDQLHTTTTGWAAREAVAREFEVES